MSVLPEMSRPEVIQATIALGLYAMAFSKAIKYEVYRRQKGKCAVCGEHFDKLQTHHVFPHCMGGSDEEDNAVGLCPDDHLFADRMAINHNVFYPDILLYDHALAQLPET